MQSYDQYVDQFENIPADAISKANDEARKQDLYIITPQYTYNEEGLEKAYEDYMSMTKPFRRRADWITLEFFGLSNQIIYDISKAKCLKLRVPSITMNDAVGSGDTPVIESYVSASDDIDMDNMIRAIMMNRDNLDEQGMYWENQTGFVLLPCHIYTSLESLENKWDLFNLMILKHRRESDWKCQELYGFTNQKYYEWMKAKLMAGDPAQVMQTPASPSYGFSAVREYVDHLIESDDTTRFDLAESLVNIAGLTDTYDEIIAGDIISDAIDKYDGLTNNLATMDLSMNDLPMYTPDEMIDMGVNSMNQTSPEDIGLAGNWFNEYKEYFETGIKTERFVELNKNRIHELENPFNECDTLAYGWNPDVPFTPANRVLADKRIKAIMAENMTTTQIIDISDMEINESVSFENIDPHESNKVPVFVVLIEGKRPIYSDLIRLATGGIYSHALLSFDESLQKMYSYGVDKYTGPKGGLIIENIDELIRKHDDVHLKVYAVYLTREKYTQLKSNVEAIEENRNKTSYSWLHIFGALFRIPFKSNQAMFCSEFVDKMLKLTDVDATKAKASSITSPNDIDRAYKKHRKIYTVFNDIIAKYRAIKIRLLLNKLEKKAKLYTELANTLTESSFTSISRMSVRDLDMLRTLNESTSIASPNMQTIYSRLISPCLYISEDTETPIRSNMEITFDLIKPID